jgi:acetyltransferase-like isoleucine patch superfamily enzyme
VSVASSYVDALRRKARRRLWIDLIPRALVRLRRHRQYRRAFADAHIDAEADVSFTARIGPGVIARANVQIGPNVSVGACTTFGTSCLLRGAGAIEIGPFCSIAPEVVMVSENHETSGEAIFPLGLYRDGADNRHTEFHAAPICIGGDCWIGQRAIVLPGADIGPGSVVAAGSVVTAGAYPPFSIIAGTPARVVKRRFDDATVERLLVDPWWERPAEQIFGADFDRLHVPPATSDTAD